MPACVCMSMACYMYVWCAVYVACHKSVCGLNKTLRSCSRGRRVPECLSSVHLPAWLEVTAFALVWPSSSPHPASPLQPSAKPFPASPAAICNPGWCQRGYCSGSLSKACTGTDPPNWDYDLHDTPTHTQTLWKSFCCLIALFAVVSTSPSCPVLRHGVWCEGSRLRFLEGGRFWDLTQARNVHPGLRGHGHLPPVPAPLHPLCDRWTGNRREGHSRTSQGHERIVGLCLPSGHGTRGPLTVGLYSTAPHPSVLVCPVCGVGGPGSYLASQQGSR